MKIKTNPYKTLTEKYEIFCLLPCQLTSENHKDANVLLNYSDINLKSQEVLQARNILGQKSSSDRIFQLVKT